MALLKEFAENRKIPVGVAADQLILEALGKRKEQESLDLGRS
jgi:hypothetical protein